jgi:hypothetical protein
MTTPGIHFLRVAVLAVAALCASAGSLAYTSSKDAHKACDPTGVQYDSSNKQYCCGTKGGCPGPLLHKPAADAILKEVRPGNAAVPAQKVPAPATAK